MDLDAPPSTQPGSWVADVFAPELLRTARNGVGELSGAEPGRPLGRRTMLVLAWGFELWLLSSDLVAREIERFVAIGSGRHWAYGAWSAGGRRGQAIPLAPFHVEVGIPSSAVFVGRSESGDAPKWFWSHG